VDAAAAALVAAHVGGWQVGEGSAGVGRTEGWRVGHAMAGRAAGRLPTA